MKVNGTDLAAGSLFVAIGAFFALSTWFNLRIGTATGMGPGYFPLALGIIQIGFGLVIMLGAFRNAPLAVGQVSWRGAGLVVAAILVFSSTVNGLGLAPAMMGAVVLAAMATGEMAIRATLLTSLALTAFCVLVFIYALKLPFDVIGPWIME